MQFANRITHLRPEGAYVVMARAQQMEAQGREIIHLEIGQPDFDTYSNISLAGIRAIANGRTGYNPSAGIPALRAALAEDAGRRRGIALTPEQIVVGPGAKPILFMPMLALLEPGDEVIYPDPGFPTYAAAIGVSGATGVPMPLDEDSGFDLDLDALDSLLSPKTKMIIINSPGNPTGGILSQKTLEHVAEAALRLDCWVMSDEVYARLNYDGDVASIAALPGMLERTIIVDGYSKTYSMTGWRLGFGVMPAPLAVKMSFLLVHSVGCTATFVQDAGIEAILGPQDRAEEVRQAFQRRRDRLIAGLNELPGVHCHLPKGAFYAFPNVEALGQPVEELAEYLLDEAGVALLPGTSFGANGKGHLRLSYANSIENLEKALERMGEAFAKL